MVSATHGRPPARADHIGSLLRPPRLRHAFRDFNEGRLGAEEFRAIQDEAIRDIVKLQEEVGLEVVNDGEFRRGSYWGRFVELTEGLVVKPAAFTFHDEHGRELAFTAPHVSGKVRRGRPIAVDEVAFVRGLTRAITKVTLPSPSTLHFWRGAQYADPGIYETARDFFADIAEVYQQEIASLATAAAVAVSGLIGFVGLLAPHTVRMLWGPDYRRVLPLSAFLGASFLIVADILARSIDPGHEVPIGVVTALIGAPFFLLILRRHASRPFVRA